MSGATAHSGSSGKFTSEQIVFAICGTLRAVPRCWTLRCLARHVCNLCSLRSFVAQSFGNLACLRAT
jgi:hypothetical protein